MSSPEATYDSLFIIAHLEASLHGVTEGEVHLFAYLSDLLGLFRGVPSAEWGYTFMRTKWGAPFSREIAEALRELSLSGHVCAEIQDAVAPMVPTEGGRELLKDIDRLELCKSRRPFLEASCGSAAAFPVAAIRRAIRSEPTLKSASGHSGPQELLAGPSLGLLYEQFGALERALGGAPSDLFVPSSVWLSYLIEKSISPEPTA